jgi:hypothetical protein
VDARWMSTSSGAGPASPAEGAVAFRIAAQILTPRRPAGRIARPIERRRRQLGSRSPHQPLAHPRRKHEATPGRTRRALVVQPRRLGPPRTPPFTPGCSCCRRSKGSTTRWTSSASAPRAPATC